ncbi:MAG: thrombospondin type 3 repeat-containing protein [Candidatus Campbellbacteria bacterium]|nr:thrombospondin type 3 repeat-containing protein [Candidatus Campbellbacteria bacterium]
MQPDSFLHKPSKRIFALGIIAIAVIASVVLFKIKPSTTQQGVLKNEVVSGTIVTEIDSDADGLKDWEEALWGTDPKMTDSNGDGIGDLAEVRNKKIEIQTTREQILNSATSSMFSYFEQGTNITKTDALSRALFEQVIAFKTAGIPLTKEDAIHIASTLGSVIEQAPDTNQKQFQLSNLSIIETPTTAQLHTYGNTVAGALKVTVSEQNNEFFVFEEFAKTGNVASFVKLSPVIQHYKDVVAKLRGIATPRDISASYLDFINTTQITATILGQLQTASVDSVAIIPVLQTYQTNYDARVAALRAIKTYLVAQNITYTDFEDGFLLVTMD